MARSRTPAVSIGLPVHDGETYLAQAIESILGQTFADFELIICDNASSDATEAIARSYAKADDRIVYARSPQNYGVGHNFRRAFERAAPGKYFKWAADDDICLPTFLAKCVAALESDQSSVLSYPHTALVGPTGETLAQMDPWEVFASAKSHLRYHGAFIVEAPYMHWGLIRSDVLRKTPLLGSYRGADRTLLAELALQGPFHIVPEVLLYVRHHPHRYPKDDLPSAIEFYDPQATREPVFHEWRLFLRFLVPILRVPRPPVERIACLRSFFGEAIRRRKRLAADLRTGCMRLPLVGRRLRRSATIAMQRERDEWREQTMRLVALLRRCVPPDRHLVLVDDMTLDAALFDGWRTSHFPEVAGVYVGVPFSDEHALAALEQLLRHGGGVIAFAWPCLWWLDYYQQFSNAVRERFPCILENELGVVFDASAGPGSVASMPDELVS